MEPTTVIIKDNSANPAPLGLLAFGLTTVLLNLHNAGIFEMNSMILAMGIFYGGIAQIIAGIMESKKNNTFGFVAFVSYGSFWLTLVGLIVIPKFGWVPAASSTAMMSYLVMWGIFTGLLFIGTLRSSRALQFVFATLTILFFLLAFGESEAGASIKTFTGYEGIVCGVSAIYAGIGALLNEVYGRTILPLGLMNNK
ncbi:MAG TPA: acetate uptake transporter [Hanamia sp.]|nr:acetate uptake transporter [Hanamia sp.]